MPFLTHAVAAAAGLIMGAFLLFVLLERRRRKAHDDRERAESLTRGFEEGRERLKQERESLVAGRDELRRQLESVTEERAHLAAQHIPLAEYQHENAILKRDLLNLDTAMRKLQVDERGRVAKQRELDARGRELAERYLADVERWIAASISASNYAACKQRLQKVIDWCGEIGFEVPPERNQQLFDDLKLAFEREVKSALEREEQARIRAQIREEQAREREVQRELDALEREREAIRVALERAMADAGATHSAEVDLLKARLADAEARNQRAISQAQLTRAGHIYVISNVGAFGDGVVKIGMTRRLEPLDRISELGDASVPFPFDIHMMISCEDAPTLENALHREFHKRRLNKVNPRKEFFRIALDDIRQFVEARHGAVEYVAEPAALEYRQSMEMSDADQEYIERVFEDVEQTLGRSTIDD